MEQLRTIRSIIPVVFFFLCGFISQAQEREEKPSESSIFCAELDIEVDGFEAIEPSIIRVCCGGPFQDNLVPCKIISKASYESFTGQSDEVLEQISPGIFVNQLVMSKKDKLYKVKQIEVINSSTTISKNNQMITIRKGLYEIDAEGKIYLELEFVK